MSLAGTCHHVVEPLRLETNSRNEVIKVGEQSLLPLTQSDLQAKLTSFNKQDL